MNIETSWRRRDDYYAIAWRGKWKTELGGCCLTHSIHAHDMLTYICGPVHRVFARCATRVNPVEVEDCAAITFEMADGSLAASTTTLGRADEISRHSFVFRKAQRRQQPAPLRQQRRSVGFQRRHAGVQAPHRRSATEFTPEPEHYQGQFARFHRALAEGTPLPATLADARQSLELITAIYHSADTGEAVTLPIAPEHPKYTDWTPAKYRES